MKMTRTIEEHSVHEVMIDLNDEYLAEMNRILELPIQLTADDIKLIMETPYDEDIKDERLNIKYTRDFGDTIWTFELVETVRDFINEAFWSEMNDGTVIKADIDNYYDDFNN